jgi:phospholipase C
MVDKLPHPTIKHVVVLMLENRGFDHLMGWLYRQDETPAITSRQGDDRPFMGLSTLTPRQLALLANPFPHGGPSRPPNRGARSPKSPSRNPGEHFPHIMNQLWGVCEPADAWTNPQRRKALIEKLSRQDQPPVPMTGYVLDYAAEVFAHTQVALDAAQLGEILDTYLPEQLPVLSGLARYYAVSDEWYCSVPSQTNTNRAFSMTGTSRGMVNNSFYDPFVNTKNPLMRQLMEKSHGLSNADTLPVSTRSIFEVMEQFGFSWKIYWQSPWPPKLSTPFEEYQYVRTMLPLLQSPSFNANFIKFDAGNPQNDFFQAARDGTLPALSWIEPKWGGGSCWDTKARLVGNDMHPVSDTTVAEDFVMNVYKALSGGPAWKETLFVITFDENGGTYDHMPPPHARPSHSDRVPLPLPKKGSTDMDPQTRTQFGFDFAQFGVRVPTLLVSPCVGQGIVFRSGSDTPFDHTSLIATILTLAEIDRSSWQLGERVAGAPTFDNVLTRDVRDIPDPVAALTVPVPRPPGEGICSNLEYVLEYVGDPWFTQPGPCYLSSAIRPGATYYYPTMTSNPDEAIKFKFVPIGGSAMVSPILNMARINIVTSEASSIGLTKFCVNPLNSCVFYTCDGSSEGAQWEIRLLSSRDPRLELRTGDLVYFVSQLSPAAIQKITDMVKPDPLQRLLPYPQDPRYVTTRGGEWALWKLSRALGADNV